MFRFRKSAGGKRPANGHTARVRPQLHLQPLELREVPAIVAPPPVVTVPDHAGDTPATARAVSLPAFRQQTAADFLPNAADVDLYKVDLKKGDYLVADVDATGAAGLASTLTLLKGDGTTVLAQNRFGTEPENRLPGIDPSLGVYVQDTGTYYLRLTTSAPTFSGQRSYNLNLERVALEESQPALALAQGGAYHAWLNQAGDTLSVAGPSGYGFSLRGNWVETVHGSAVTYSARGTLHLKTSALPGEVPLQVAAGETLTVTTDAPGWVQLGELKSVGGHFGLSLGPVAAAIRNTFGLDVNGAGVLTGWTIKTGAQIKHDYQSYVQRDIAQLLDGVPYLVSGTKGSLKVNFGSVSLTTTDQASTVLIADPADPFLYVGYKSYAAAGSVHGRIPFNTSVVPPGPHLGGYYGHVYAAGAFPLSGVPLTVNGDVTVNLDANGDGRLLGGAGNASQLFRGNLNALDNVLRDINVGVNGGVNLGYTVAGHALSVPLGQASAFYSGPNQAIYFKGTQGTAGNVWAGTPLKDFQVGPGARVEGYVSRDGRFSVSTTSNYRLLAADAALTITVTDHDITARGTLTTPIASAQVSGAIGFDGSFAWSGVAHVNVGGGDNYVRGDASFTFAKNAAGFVLDLDLHADARLSIPGVRFDGRVTGHLQVRSDAAGHVTYDAGSLAVSGHVSAYNPFTGGWNDLGPAGVSVSLNGRHLHVTAHAGGASYGFDLDLP